MILLRSKSFMRKKAKYARSEKMRNILILILIIATLLVSCESLDSLNSSSADSSEISSNSIDKSVSPTLETSSNPRTIILDGEYYNEEETGEFISWECKAYSYSANVHDNTLLEVGYFSNPEFEGKGFLLFDGGNSGIKTFYERYGVNRRWDWDKYSIVIEPDGIGSYYDFTNVPTGGTTSASGLYKCFMK